MRSSVSRIIDPTFDEMRQDLTVEEDARFGARGVYTNCGRENRGCGLEKKSYCMCLFPGVTEES
jgi:hypothetical protein